MAQAPSPEKKQKLSPAIFKTQLLLQDYTTVRQTVRDILALVQQYGPLTSGQIEYNLPKVPSSIWGIPDVLNILSSMEILRITESHAYTWNGGIPRADTVLPTEVMSKIVAAIQEAEESWKRSEILKQAMMQNNKSMNHKETLKFLLNEYPEIVNDPVYMAAFKACNIDLRGRIKRENNTKQPPPVASPRSEPTTPVVAKAAAAVAASGSAAPPQSGMPVVSQSVVVASQPKPPPG